MYTCGVEYANSPLQVTQEQTVTNPKSFQRPNLGRLTTLPFTPKRRSAWSLGFFTSPLHRCTAPRRVCCFCFAMPGRSSASKAAKAQSSSACYTTCALLGRSLLPFSTRLARSRPNGANKYSGALVLRPSPTPRLSPGTLDAGNSNTDRSRTGRGWIRWCWGVGSRVGTAVPDVFVSGKFNG